MKLDTVALPAAGSITTPVSASPGSAESKAGPVRTASPAAPALTVDAARKAAAQINEFLKSSSASVQFTVEGSSNHIIVRVIDAETRQLIRQIPSEETLAISQALDRMTGLLFAQKA